ncbi:hypothetical protein HYV80_05070 [Candidatus Woesearchaeota archaeon]|nr:hypothetical protein [Candidatus Woesearchaeota archaeon]
MRLGIIIFVLLLIIPSAYSLSINELIAKYRFSSVTPHMNVTSYTDFMIDKNSNGINDTLIFELETDNTAGDFIFAINLFDENGILTNETRKTLSPGTNKLNLTFSSVLLSQEQFNYSIKVYNASRKQKYRKDGILTGAYKNYEEGYRIAGIADEKISKALRINISLDSPVNGTHVTTLFLGYNNRTIFSKGSRKIKSGANHLLFDFGNETLKGTHFSGNFSIQSIKIGTKRIKIGAMTKSYDFMEFAESSYLYNFSDSGIDADGNGKFDFLEISASLQILKEGGYSIIASLYDLSENVVEIKNISSHFGLGKNAFPLRFNGSMLHEKKLNGPYSLKSIELYEGGILVDRITDGYTTSNYNFNDFGDSGLPDIAPTISVSGAYRYGISNITANFTFYNIGSKHAFNVDSTIFDNRTFSKSNKSNILNANSSVLYTVTFTNISDLELTAIADLANAVEELNESNNAFKAVIKLNKRPILNAVSNITASETDKIVLNLSASDPNGDNVTYSISLSKFSNSSNIFQWNTSVADSGNYTLEAAASDGYLNDSLLFRITILDAPEKDIDDDGIEDDADSIIGLENSVNASGINLSILVNESRNLSKTFNHDGPVMFMDASVPLAEFIYNFSRHKLRLNNITLKKQSSNAAGSLLIKGVNLDGSTKTLYVDRINLTRGICIKDKEISDIGEISSNCDAGNEFKIECDATLQGNYTCAYNSTINKYKIRGVKHSGIVQIDYQKPASSPGSAPPASSAPSSGGGGGGIGCIPDWKCSKWSECAGGIRNRDCFDENKCAFASKNPVETEQCAAELHNLVDVINPPDYAGKRISRVKQSTQAPVITGQAVKSTQNPDIGIFIIFFEVVLTVGAYLVLHSKSFENV